MDNFRRQEQFVEQTEMNLELDSKDSAIFLEIDSKNL